MQIINTVQNFLKVEDLYIGFQRQAKKLEIATQNGSLTDEEERELANGIYNLAVHYVSEQIKHDANELGIEYIELCPHEGVDKLTDLLPENMQSIAALQFKNEEIALVVPLDWNEDAFGLQTLANGVVETAFRNSDFLFISSLDAPERVNLLDLQFGENMLLCVAQQSVNAYLHIQIDNQFNKLIQSQKMHLGAQINECHFVPSIENGRISGVSVIYQQDDYQLIRKFSKDYDIWAYFNEGGFMHDKQNSPVSAKFDLNVNLKSIPPSTMYVRPHYNDDIGFFVPENNVLPLEAIGYANAPNAHSGVRIS